MTSEDNLSLIEGRSAMGALACLVTVECFGVVASVFQEAGA